MSENGQAADAAEEAAEPVTYGADCGSTFRDLTCEVPNDHGPDGHYAMPEEGPAVRWTDDDQDQAPTGVVVEIAEAEAEAEEDPGDYPEWEPAPSELIDVIALREEVTAALEAEGCPPLQSKLLASVYVTSYRMDALAAHVEGFIADGGGGGIVGKILKGVVGRG